ncbi:unnamed protein product [Vitrella brassicaformis CCMP3155]|uniref:Uncharacterized protein n=2 Tax=Vitrella brassicaformis TaxID=1169539 RepID=A0A0G4GRU7_VITBC|nr:unnamed protein product [Vitrella brassicaformis CCMP3155]|eukprot:CEM33350.1 unnamed protein product [Vitrella brassicaformis CCMP3155]
MSGAPALKRGASRVVKLVRSASYVLEHTSAATLAESASITLAIYTFFFAFGLSQQKIYQYGTGHDKFRYSNFLLLVSSMANFVLSFGIILVRKRFSWHRATQHLCTKAVLNRVVFLEIFYCSLTSVLGKVSGYHALTLVDYPTQALAKCAKPVSIVILGFLHFKRRYSTSEVVNAFWIVGSLVIFNLANIKAAENNAVNTLWGNLMLLFSLTCDGMTGSRQDVLSRQFRFTSYEMMCVLNGFSIVFAIGGMVVVEGVSAPLQFMARYPDINADVLIFCVCGALGQFASFVGVRRLGVLPTTLITTTRKLFMVLVSVAWFNTSLAMSQWAAVASIFVAVIWKHSQKKEKKTILRSVSTPDIKSRAEVDVADIGPAPDLSLPLPATADHPIKGTMPPLSLHQHPLPSLELSHHHHMAMRGPRGAADDSLVVSKGSRFLNNPGLDDPATVNQLEQQVHCLPISPSHHAVPPPQQTKESSMQPLRLPDSAASSTTSGGSSPGTAESGPPRNAEASSSMAAVGSWSSLVVRVPTPVLQPQEIAHISGGLTVHTGRGDAPHVAPPLEPIRMSRTPSPMLPGDAAGGQVWRQSSPLPLIQPPSDLTTLPHPLPHPHAYHTHTHSHLDEMVTSDADQLHHARRREKATAGGGEMLLGPEGDVESGVRSGHGHLSEGEEDDHGHHHGHPSLMQAAKRWWYSGGSIRKPPLLQA